MVEESAEDKIKKMQKARLAMVLKELPDLPSTTLSFLAGNAENELDSRAGEHSENAGLLKIGNISEDIDEAYRTQGKFSGLHTGLALVDDLIGGLKPSETTLIAGASNNGKSFLAAYMASRVAQQVPTLFITLEMQPATLGARIKSMVGEDYKNLELYFQKTFKLDYRTVEPLIKNAYKQGVRAVFIDYLQYLGVGMRPDEVAKISRMLSELTLTYNIPMVVVVSIRKQDTKNDKKWTAVEMEDIMGTSAIGYDADNVVLVSRKDIENEYDPDGMWIKHLKSRNMPVYYGGGQYVRFLFGYNSLGDDPDFNSEFRQQYLQHKKQVKKIEQPEVKQIPIDKNNLSKFEQRKLGVDGENLSGIELSEIPF